MPQGRKKVPFSGKAKKMQLKEKKSRKLGLEEHGSSKILKTSDDKRGSNEAPKLNEQPLSRGGKRNPNRYALQFHKETEAEICERKEAARHAITPVSEEQFEISIEDFFPQELDFPKRPPWNFDMSREELEAREQRYFREYVSNIEKKFDWKDLGYFELNLETWRQLWRVLEMSDVILVIVDIRYPALMFPPSLYHHVTTTVRKDMILVLNKIDLAPASLVVAWKCYFQKKFPELKVLMFTSYPSYNLRGNQNTTSGLQVRRRRGKMRMAAEGAQKLYEACKGIVKNEVDLSSWESKILEEMHTEYETDDLEVGETITLKKVDTSFVEHEKYLDGTLTIGCVGHPNVGKSSLMNSIMGKKVVSVSRTPGHTKHFQTIYLTSSVRLCDCPGLVFPSKAPKSLQVLSGSYPIAQLREPYSVVQFLAQRLDLPRLLKVQHPEGDEEWSAMDICDAWAKKRGFYTARTARLDTYRAANDLLRMALDGKICLCLRPPEFLRNKEHWESCEELELVKWIQARNTTQTVKAEEFELSEDEDSIAGAGCGEQEAHSGGDENESEEEDDEEEEEETEDNSRPHSGVHNKFTALCTADDE